MSNENDKKAPEPATPGPGVQAWLSQVFDTLQPAQTHTQPSLPAGLSGTAEPVHTIRFNVPADVITSTGGTLQRLEIRGLPKGVSISGSQKSEDGYWLAEPAMLNDLGFVVPSDIALPFSIMLKGVFSGTENDQTWVELAGFEVTDDANIEKPETPVAQETRETALPSPLAVIDLDVSVGTRDPAILQGINVQFSGLPEGASLNCGTHDENGVWLVPARDLHELSIVFPADTEDFELNVIMFIDGTEPQSATIQVTNDAVQANPQSSFTIRLAPNGEAGAIRFSVFSDGSATYDRIIQWPDGPDAQLDIQVPYLEDTLPFEIVMRHQPYAKGQRSSPKLIGVTIDGDFIAPNSFAISANGNVDSTGLSWEGDLVIDVRRALKTMLSATDDNAEKSETDDTTATITQPPAIAENHDETVTGDTADVETMAVTTPSDVDEPSPAPRQPEPVEPDVLFMDATFDDLQSTQFIGELRRLRDFIRSRPSSQDGEVYARLGIDVTKWHDMRVIGPTGSDVVLDPLLPALAPRGGIDNTRFVAPVRLLNLPDEEHIMIRITGMTPGSLLTHGRNMGNGTWLLNITEAAGVGVLPPLGIGKTVSAHVAWQSDPENPASAVLQASLLIGGARKRSPYAANEMRTLSLPLDPELFDPDGHRALSITIGDLPPGTLLSGGRNHGGGVWTLETTSGAMLTLNAATASKPFTITLTCVALDSESGDSTVVSRGLDVIPAQGKIRLKKNLAA